MPTEKEKMALEKAFGYYITLWHNNPGLGMNNLSKFG